jgi:hypothetical protein
MYFGFIAAGITLVGIALTGIWYVIKVLDFRQLYYEAHRNSLWLFHLCSHHPVATKLLELDEFKWSGIATNSIIAAQGGMLFISVILSVLVKNIFLFIPLFLLLREVFILIAMFLRRKRTMNENIGLESMLRLFLVEVNETRSRRESLGRMAEKLTGIWCDAIGKLYRRLGNGGSNEEFYMELAQTFPNNQHVRLLTQLLNYSDTHGGDIKDALTQLISDVMNDRMDAEKNKSETAATLFITLIINLGVVLTAIINLIVRPMAGEVLIGTFGGQVLLAAAALCCFLSLRITKKIVEE